MNLNSWLSYLETLHPKEIDLGLERVGQVAEQLHLLPLKNTVITVAGTNGKGSCVTLLKEILLSANYRVGTYTSPHLLRYNERVCINGVEVSDADLCGAFTEIEFARKNISLSYFEFGTLAALLLFKRANLDIIILEVGMGGRLDATNIVDADVAIISTIALDHIEWLGNTRELIGFEKAGIIRKNKPAVCGDFATPNSIKRYAANLQASLYCQGDDFSFETDKNKWIYKSQQQTIADLPLPKIALQNAATILKTIELLPKSIQLSRENIVAGLQQVFIPGRFQVIEKPVLQILDVAHNPAAAQLFAKQLQQQSHSGKTLAVVAMLGDKDHEGTLQPLLPFVDQWFVAGLAVPRGGSASKLTACLRKMTVNTYTEYLTVTHAYQAALALAANHDRIIVFGSFYTVGEVMQLLATSCSS